MDIEYYRQLDRDHLWHPYTRFSAVSRGDLPMIVRGEGIHLFDADGRRYVDAVSSWWACSLGHNHPRIVQAIIGQASRLQHSILGNLSHPAAVELAARLAGLMPDTRCHVHFASDGASAVEAALKIAIQHAHNKGETGRVKFASLEDAYHGDTLGAVGVGYLEEFHLPLKAMLSSAIRLPLPVNGCYNDPATLLDKNANELAAVIVEPLCLGAGGMRMYPSDWLRRLSGLCRERGILMIVDEIAMGFGRTGRMFAFEHAGIEPDIVCVGKALSAGYLPISAAIVRDEIFKTFNDEPEDHTFYHGHTYAGNPIAAAAALETLRVYEDDNIIQRAADQGDLLKEWLQKMEQYAGVREVRCLGLIGVVELEPDYSDGNAPARPRRIQQAMRERGYLIRPLDNVVYLMPPLNIAEADLKAMVDALSDSIRKS